MMFNATQTHRQGLPSQHPMEDGKKRQPRKILSIQGIKRGSCLLLTILGLCASASAGSGSGWLGLCFRDGTGRGRWRDTMTNLTRLIETRQRKFEAAAAPGQPSTVTYHFLTSARRDETSKPSQDGGQKKGSCRVLKVGGGG